MCSSDLWLGRRLGHEPTQHPDVRLERRLIRLEAKAPVRAAYALPLTLAGMVALPTLTWHLAAPALRWLSDYPEGTILWAGGSAVLMCHFFAGIGLAAPVYNLWFLLFRGYRHMRSVQLAGRRYDERRGGPLGRMLHRYGLVVFWLLVVPPVLSWGPRYTVVSDDGIEVAVADQWRERVSLPMHDIVDNVAVVTINRFGERSRPKRYLRFADGTVLSDRDDLFGVGALTSPYRRDQVAAAFARIDAASPVVLREVEVDAGEEVPGITDVVPGVRARYQRPQLQEIK